MTNRSNCFMGFAAAVMMVLLSGFCTVQARPAPALQALTHFYNQVDTLRTHFRQVQMGSQGHVLRKAEGEFYLDRPGQFRWNYEKPYKQSIISDGETLWV